MLDEFLQYIFGGDQEGYFAVSLFQGGAPQQERFFHWPEDTKYFTEDVLHAMASVGDVYYTPALYSERTRMAQSCVGSWVAWVDLDQPPADVASEAVRQATWPAAGLVVASGSPGRSHRYWRSERFLGPSQARAATESLTQYFGADKSGVDVSQLLRLPGTFNHKHTPPAPVYIVEGNLATIQFPDFLEVPDNVIDFPSLGIKLEPFSINKLLALDDYTLKLFRSTPVEGARSDRMFELACRLFENSWTEGNVKVLLDQADKNWKKFTDRPDRDEQLDTLIGRAKGRTTPLLDVVEQGFTVSARSILTSTKRMEWIVPGMLSKSGLMYLVGPTGIGKTTLALNLSLTVALQHKEWLGLEVEQTEQKVMFASHEMPDVELAEFLRPMAEELSEIELHALEEVLHFHAEGPHYLDDPKVQLEYERELRQGNFTGFVVDTLGASVSTSLQDEPTVRKIADWLDRLRQDLGIWVVMVAHPRKRPAGKQVELTTDDVYGSRLFADRANTVLIMDRERGGITLRSTKTRFLSGIDTMFIKRTANHWFETTTTPPTPASTKQSPPITVVGADDITTDDLKGSDDLDL